MQKTLFFSLLLSNILLQANEKNHHEDDDFLSDMSLILNASAVSRNIKNSDYEGYGIDGFVNATNEIPFNKNRGFNLNYAEFGMHSELGDYLDLEATFHLHPTEFEIEEAFVSSKKLPTNLQLKLGQFRSAFGYINSIHLHAQHFLAQPLVYEAMLGVEGIKDAGLALNWVAPTDTYLMLGVEAMQGTNEQSFGYVEKNNLYVGYLKTGFDLGDATSILAGTSVARGKTTSNKESSLYNVELRVKHTLQKYSSITWQNEYMYRDKNNAKQAGLYSQLIYNMNDDWEFGMRYDMLNKNLENQPNDLRKSSLIVAYQPFESSKLRLQYTKDQSKSFVGTRRDENFIALDFIVEIASEGDHDGHEH